MAQRGLQSAIGECAEVAVVAIGSKAAGEIALDTDLFIPSTPHQRCRCCLLIDAEISYGRSGANFRIFWRSGNEVDRTSNRIGTVERRSRTPKHFNSFQ